MKVFSKGWRSSKIFKINIIFLQNFHNFLTFFLLLELKLKSEIHAEGVNENFISFNSFLENSLNFFFILPVMENIEAPNMIQPCQCVPQ